MPERVKKVCWDSCAFLSYIEGTKGRIKCLREVFQEAVNKEIELCASSICITEVAFTAAERAGGLSEKTERVINKLWSPGSPIRVIDYSQLVARKAQKLLRHTLKSKLKLKPLDAIHIATAMQSHATELHTYDENLYPWSECSGVKIMKPKAFQQMLLKDE